MPSDIDTAWSVSKHSFLETDVETHSPGAQPGPACRHSPSLVQELLRARMSQSRASALAFHRVRDGELGGKETEGKEKVSPLNPVSSPHARLLPCFG